MNETWRKLLLTVCTLYLVNAIPLHAVEVRGPEEHPDVLMRWHRVSLTFDGPSTSECAEPNPYFQYRLDVTLRGPGGQVATVPGFFAADGKAGRTGADSGNKWRAYFCPDQVGTWTWKASMRQGKDVSIDTYQLAGEPWKPLDGQSGTFEVAESNKSRCDLRSPDKGRLRNRGHHYLTFASGQIFLKGGPGVPENMLGYYGFDNTRSHNKRGPLYEDIPPEEIYLLRSGGR